MRILTTRAGASSRNLLAALALSLLTLAVVASAARAEFGLVPGSFVADAYQSDGVTSELQAGITPAFPITTFAFNRGADGVSPDGNVKDIRVDLPPGLVGNPQSVPTCPRRAMNDGGFSDLTCPAQSQVGVLDVTILNSAGTESDFPKVPVYNLTPREGEVAEFGFRIVTTPVRIIASVRPGDHGVTALIPNIPEALPLLRSKLVMWGTPASPAHDMDRKVYCITAFFCSRTSPPGSAALPPVGQPLPSGLDPVPFWRNPTRCAGPLTTTVSVDSWQEPGAWKSDSYTTASGPTRCDRLSFEPTISVRPDTGVAGAPTGLSVDLDVPQNQDPAGLATAHVDRVSVTLPEGMRVSPSAADGLGGCSDEQIALGTDADPACPDSSVIGTMSVQTPVLADPLEGRVYLGTQTPSQLLRLFLVVRGHGVQIKLAGKVDPDPVTGRLTAVFVDNPQLPFSRLSLHFKGGPRATLVNPPACGTYTTTSTLSSWAGQVASPSDSFTIDQGCGQETRFEPVLSAGLRDPRAGVSSSFSLVVGRPDGQQDMSGLTVSLPTGVLGDVGSVPVCPEVQAVAGVCGPESQVGRVSVVSGPGVTPISVPQPGKAPTGVYLAGPYKGAPYSLSIVVPAQAGPFDLGTVVVRAALFVDPHDAHVTVVSDPLPTILQGIPLQIQRLDVSIDRPGFMVSPTSCAAKAVGATVQSVTGALAHLAAGFRVSDCGDLAFDPRLNLALTNKSQTRDGGHPGVLALVRQAPGESAIEGARVQLPLHLALDPDNANGLCEYDDGLRSECPAVSIVGKAVAVSPILRQPLTGPVYFVKGVRFNARGERVRTLPTLLVKLSGENGLRLDLRARSDIDQDTGQLVNTFQDVPDAPISSFSLQIDGGKHGILVVTHDQDICKPAVVPDGVSMTDHPGAAIAADADFDGHSGASSSNGVTIATPCALQVYSRAYTASRMSVTTGGFMGPGTLKISGAGIKTTTRKIAGDSTDMATITASLNATGRAARKAKKTLTIRVSFTPKGQKTETTTYPRPKAKKKR